MNREEPELKAAVKVGSTQVRLPWPMTERESNRYAAAVSAAVLFTLITIVSIAELVDLGSPLVDLLGVVVALGVGFYVSIMLLHFWLRPDDVEERIIRCR